MPIIIIIEIKALKKKLSGNRKYHTTARIIARILHVKIHIMKVGMNDLGASFLSSDIIIWMRMFLKNLILYFIKKIKITNSEGSYSI